MTTLYVLVVWSYVSSKTMGWLLIGEFAGEQRCVAAATTLGLKQPDFRCLDTGKITR